VEAVTAGDEITVRLVLGVVMAESDHWLRRIEIRHRDVLGVEVERSLCLDARVNQIPDDLVLSVDRDCPAASHLRQIDPMSLPVEADVETVVPEPRALETGTGSHRLHQIDGPLFEH